LIGFSSVSESDKNITPLGWDEFERVDMRVGTIMSARINEQARKPSYVMEIDFGPLGLKISSAQITDRYLVEELPGRQVVAVVNFPPKRIAGINSECLVLGAVDAEGVVTLLKPDPQAANGDRIA
jgi:tRNA-binding protein